MARLSGVATTGLSTRRILDLGDTNTSQGNSQFAADPSVPLYGDQTRTAPVSGREVQAQRDAAASQASAAEARTRNYSYQGAVPAAKPMAAKTYSPTAFKRDKDTSLKVRKK